MKNPEKCSQFDVLMQNEKHKKRTIFDDEKFDPKTKEK